MYVLWSICYKLEPCILIISNTKNQSETLLSHIRNELSKNMELQRDFPEVCGLPKRRWRSNEIITKNDVNVRISSETHGIRGIRHKAERPTLVILDDVESTESVRSQEGREKLSDWFSKDVLNLGSDKTNYIVVGTILHFDSLLARLTSKEREEFPGFERRVYRSVIHWADNQVLWNRWSQIYCCKESYANKTGIEAALKFFENHKSAMLKGTEVLWSEKEDYYGLMVIREDKGHFSFESEKQNEPKDPSTLTLDMKKVDWWEDKHQNTDDLIAYLKTRNMVVLGALDPAIGTSKRSDYSAIITALMDGTNGNIYVIDADIRKWKIDSLVKRICEYQKIHKYSSFVYEANAAQAWLGDMIKKEPVNVPIKPVTNTQSKEGRIAKLMLLIEQGKVKLSKKLEVLNRQLSYYPSGDHDDGIDALAMLVDMADDFSQRGMEEIKELLGRMEKPKYDPKEISMIDPASGGTTYIDNSHGLFRI